MNELFEGETIESRMALIQWKLKNIPMEEDAVARYYIYYKHDVRFLLELLAGYTSKYNQNE